MIRRPLLLVILLGVVLARPAHAQTAPASPSALSLQRANFAWDKTLLRASFSYQNVFTPALVQKLSNGLATDIVLRAYVWKEGDSNPTALAAKTCHVVYDLWDEVFRIEIHDPAGRRTVAAVNTAGVMRQCAEARDLPIVDRALLEAGKTYFLAVIAEIDPVSPQMLAQMRAWVSKPAGSTGITSGNALFGSFVGLFVRSIGTSAATLQFRTQTWVP